MLYAYLHIPGFRAYFDFSFMFPEYLCYMYRTIRSFQKSEFCSSNDRCILDRFQYLTYIYPEECFQAIRSNILFNSFRVDIQHIQIRSDCDPISNSLKHWALDSGTLTSVIPVRKYSHKTEAA